MSISKKTSLLIITVIFCLFCNACTSSGNKQAVENTTTNSNTEINSSTNTDTNSNVNKSIDKEILGKFVANIDMIKNNLNNSYYINPADETAEELQSYIDNRWCMNPRGVEWLYFAQDVELYLKDFSNKSSYGKDMLEVFKRIYYGDKDGSADQSRSGQENIDLTLRWLDNKIKELKTY